MIWVKPSDKEVILSKIANNAWAKEYFEDFKNRIADDVATHQKNPDAKQAQKYFSMRKLTYIAATIPVNEPEINATNEIKEIS